MSDLADRLDPVQDFYALAAQANAASERLRATAARTSAACDYLTIEEVAALARCEHKTVRGAIARGELAAGRPGRRWLIRETEARAWIERPRPPARRKRARSENHPRRKPRGAAPADTVSALKELDPEL